MPEALKISPPELALHLQSWLNIWPTEARDLWHDLARGRLPAMKYQTRDGQQYAGGSWPAWCYMPNPLIENWMMHRGDLQLPFFQDLTERHDRYLPGDQLGFVPMLAAFLTRWRLGKGVYRIHPHMLANLRDTELTPEIPIACLYHLPEWAVVVETPGFEFLGSPIAGFTAYLNTNYPLHPDPAIVLHLFKPGPYEAGQFRAYTRSLLLTHDTLGACYDASMANMNAAAVQQTGWRELVPYISLLLYLCSDNREIHDPAGRAFKPPAPREKVTRKGPKAFAANNISNWQVAYRIGAALEAAERGERTNEPALPSAPTGVPRRPHIRRAHWHLYWSGKGREVPRVRWLPPIAVNVARGHEPTVTVHPVGGKGEK